MKAQDKTDAIVEAAGFCPTDAEARVRADKVVALAQAEVVKLRALAPPRADAKKVAKVYDAIDAGWAAVADDPELLTAEPSPLARATKSRRPTVSRCAGGVTRFRAHPHAAALRCAEMRGDS